LEGTTNRNNDDVGAKTGWPGNHPVFLCIKRHKRVNQHSLERFDPARLVKHQAAV